MSKFSWGTHFRGVQGGYDQQNPTTYENAIISIYYEENAIATNFEPHECVMFAQSTKNGTHKIKVINSIFESDDMKFAAPLTLNCL